MNYAEINVRHIFFLQPISKMTVLHIGLVQGRKKEYNVTVQFSFEILAVRLLANAS